MTFKKGNMDEFLANVERIRRETGPTSIQEEEKLSKSNSKSTKSGNKSNERKIELIRARPNFIKKIGNSVLEPSDLIVGKVVKWNLKSYYAYYSKFLAQPIWVDDEKQVFSRKRVESHERAKEFFEKLEESDLVGLYLSDWPSQNNGNVDLVVNSNNEPRCKFCGELLEGPDHFVNNGNNGQVECPKVKKYVQRGFGFFRKVERNGKTFLVTP